MSESHEIRWEIDAYTAETMPLDRLIDYMGQLPAMLGEPKHLHLLKVESGSTVPVLRVDQDGIERIRQRSGEIRNGTAPNEAMEAYRNVNRMLREDGATASLYEGDAEIIPFPGQKEPPPLVSGVQQQGSLDGQLIKIGGEKDWVPIQLLTLEEAKITGCYAKKALAKQMGSHLWESVRLYGRGRWTRTVQGQWHLDKFYIDSFETLSEQPLPSVVTELRNIKSDWIENPIADILDEQ
jgi:hypothetical protein